VYLLAKPIKHRSRGFGDPFIAVTLAANIGKNANPVFAINQAPRYVTGSLQGPENAKQAGLRIPGQVMKLAERGNVALLQCVQHAQAPLQTFDNLGIWHGFRPPLAQKKSRNAFRNPERLSVSLYGSDALNSTSRQKLESTIQGG
jgi:hypothetical protein